MSNASKRKSVKMTQGYVDGLPAAASQYSKADSEVRGLQVRVLPSGTKVYSVRAKMKDGRRVNAVIGNASSITLDAARKLAKKEIARVLDNENPNETKRRARIEAITIKEFLNGTYWREVLSRKKAGANTKQRIESSFEDFLDRKLNDKTIGNAIKNWRTQRLEGGGRNRKGERTDKGVSESTVNKDTNALRALFNEAVRCGLIQENPLKSMKQFRDTGKRIIRFLSQDEETRLRKALEKRDNDGREGRASKIEWCRERKYAEPAPIPADGFLDHLTPMVLVSMNTGLRRGELFGLRWDDVDFTHSVLTVRRETSKSDNARTVPLNAEAADVLKRWSAQQEDRSGLVFPGKNGGQFDTIKKSWTALLEAAEIEGFRWHDLRHHFASRLVQSGVNLGVVCALLGHSDFKLTQRYAHFAPSQKAQAVASIAFGPADNIVEFPSEAQA